MSLVILHVLNLKISHMTFLTHRQRQLFEKCLDSSKEQMFNYPYFSSQKIGHFNGSLEGAHAKEIIYSYTAKLNN